MLDEVAEEETPFRVRNGRAGDIFWVRKAGRLKPDALADEAIGSYGGRRAHVAALAVTDQNTGSNLLNGRLNPGHLGLKGG